MDTSAEYVIEIPSGTVQSRLVFGIPAEAAWLMFMLACMTWWVFKNPWLMIPLVPIWGFLKFQSYRDPHFLSLWAGALTCKPFYSA